MIDQAQKAAKVKNALLKKEAGKTPTADLPPSVAQQLVAATRQSEDLKTKIAAKEATAKETMSQLENLGTGLAMVGNAIMTMATPITDDDPIVQRLANELLVSDPTLRAAGEAFAKRLQDLLADKKQAVAELMRLQQLATSSLDTVTRNLGTMTQLSRHRQSIDMGLDPTATAYLKETRDAAKDALAELIYWFVKSYQYESLEDVEDSFFNFDTWRSKLQEQEKLKQASATPASTATQGAVVTRAPRVLLSKADLETVGDAVFKAEQFKLGANLLAKRQTRAPSDQGKYTDCVLRRTDNPITDWEKRQNEMLHALGQGELVFDWVRDFEKGSDAWNDARVVQVKFVKLDIDASDDNLSLTFRVEQRGDMVIAKKVGTERQFFMFQPGSHDDRVGWKCTYNHQERKTDSGITASKSDDPLAGVAKEMLSPNLTFQEYQPALFSDYAIRITDLYGSNGKRKGLTAIDGLNLMVFLSSASSEA